MILFLRTFLLIALMALLGSSPGYAQAPVANFSSNITTGCSPIVVQFTDLSTNNPTSWSWDLGNGTIASVQSPSTTYVMPGSYTVVLTASNASGSNTKTVVSYITANPTPTVAFTATDVTPECSSKTVQFTNQSISNSSGTTTYYWDFGDGATSNAQNPLHTYTTPGNYSVSLVVTNGVGCNQVLTKINYITVLPKPVASFNALNNNSCTAPLTATFTNTSAGGASYFWDFGDGGTSTATSPTHTYTASGSYTVRLITVSAAGCRDTLIRPATVNIGSLTAAFTISTTTACTRNAVSFTNTTTPGAGNSTWYFGDGGTSTAASPNHAYTTAGTYTVKLVVNYNNCSDSITHTITVTSGAATAFSGSPLTSCQVPLTTTFTNSTTGGVSYLWLFGDGSTSTAANPTHTYTAMGSYNVTLVSTSVNGCRDTLVKPAYIVLAPPTGYISFNGANGGCIPLPKTFTANITSGQTIASYSWDFGDGSTGTGATAAHTYTTAGTFLATLTYTTSSGCIGTTTTIMSAGAHAVLAFTASPLTVCSGSPVTFTNTSTGGTVYSWDFGDAGGTSSAYSPTYSYAEPGQYTVTLTSNSNQCYDVLTKVNLITVQPPLADFTTAYSCAAILTRSFTNTSVGATSYLWDFGDGQTSTATSPTHTYAVLGDYTVTLTAYNNATGCSNVRTIPLGLKPVQAQFTATPTTVCAKTSAAFTVPADASLTSWVMNFGDGVTSAVTPGAFGHIYNNPGVYSVKLVVTNSNGCKDSLIRNNYITVSGPTAGFTASAVSGCSPVTLTLNNTSVASSASPIANTRWNFGDGTSVTTTAATVSHTYTVSGTYAVTLIVTDGNGCTDSLTRTNYITVGKPTAAFSASANGCVGSAVTFTNSSTGAATLGYQWSFGDGGTSSAANPAHVYTSAGTYTVRLIVTDGNGCKDTVTKAASINIGSVTAGFTTIDTLGFCPPYTVNLTNTSIGATSYIWDFGNGNSSTGPNPVAVYSTAGTFTITLKSYNAYGCVDSAKKIIRVNPGPSGTLTYTPVSGCLPLSITFSATTVNTTSLVWDFNNGITQTTSGNSITYTYNTPGAYLPKLVLSNNSGCSTGIIGADTIKINKVTSGFTAAPSPVCVGIPVTFTDTSKTVTSPVTARNWSFGDATTGTGATTTHAYAAAGTYTVRLVANAAGGCTDTSYRTVVVNPLPVIVADNGAVCGGQSVQLNASGADTYSWSPATGLSCTTCANPVASPTSTTTYTITGTNGLGCVTTKTVTVTISPLPTVSAGSAQTICAGNTAQLQATGAATYEWTPATGLSNPNLANPVANPATTTTYTVTGTSAAGCKNTAQVTVTVIPNPTLNISPNQTICIGDSTTLTVSGAASFVWSPATGLNTTTGTSVIAKPTVTTTYTVLGNTITNGCQSAGSVTVTVNPLPVINPGTSRAICAGDSTQLTTTGAATYEWTPATGLSCTACTSPSASPAATTTYIVTGTSATGCVNRDTVIVTVNPIPTVNAGTNQFICPGGSTTLTATGADTYVWSPATGLSCTNCASPIASPTATTVYTVTGTTAANCSSTATVSVTINSTPVISINGNRTLCLGDSTQLAANGADTYVWSPATGLSCTACANPVAKPAATTTYTIVGTSGAGCTGTTTTTITVNPLPTVNAGADRAICAGTNTTLTATGATSYVWSPATGLSCANCAAPSASPAATTTYIVTGTSTTGCVSRDTVIVTVNPLPVVNAGPNQFICPGGSATLTATGADSYVWSPATGLSCTTCASPTASPASSITYTVTGTSTAGCVNTATVAVNINNVPVVNIAGNRTICLGDSTQLTASGANSYVWTPATGLSCTTCANPTAKPTTTTTYTIVGTSGVGCTATTTATITVNPLPTVSAGADKSVCAGANTTLTATGAATYVWSPATGLSCTACASPTASPAATTTYIVTGTSAIGCVNTDTVLVTINSLPTVSAGTNQFICPGGSATLTATGAASYVWSPATGLSCTTCASPTASPATTTTYTVTGTSAAGCTNTSTVTVTVNNVPAVVVAGNAPICAGDSVRLTASGANTYSWSPSTGLSCVTCANPYAKPSATTTYTVTGTSGVGCSGTTTVTVTVNPLPAVSAGAAQAICAGTSATLTATGAATYVWTPATGLSCTACASPVATPTATTTYKVTGTSAAGCVKTDSVTVTVNARPSVATAGIAICPGGSGTLLATGAATYVWTPATGLSCTTCASPTASPATTTTYTVTGTGANGCTSTATATVTVNPVPVVTVTGNRSVCAGSSTTLTASGATSFVWSPATGLSCTTCASPVANPTATTTYTVTGTSGVGCTATTTVTITVNPLPVVSAGAPQTSCAGTPVTLTATGAATYSWSPSTGLSCAGCASPVATPGTTTTYIVTGTDASGCSSTSSVLVTINPLPVISAGTDTSICGLTSAQLHATGGNSYVWTPATGLSCTVCADPVATPSATTTYTVTGTGANGCTGSDAVTVSLYVQPPVNAGPDQTICAGQSAQLQASGASTYEWSPVATLSCANCANPTALPVVNTNYIVTGTDIHGCHDSDDVTISIINRTQVSVEPGGDICEGESFQLKAAGGTAYKWSPASSLDNSTIANPMATPNTTTTYQVLISQGTCFTDTLSATVNVHPIPTVNAGADRNVIAGSSVTLDPAVSNVATYAWSPADGLNCTTCANPVAAPQKTTTYTVNVTSEFGCKASDEVTVFITCDGKQLWMPNTFTPNADGQNDRFYPHGRGITTVKRFRIYDRWGELIYDVTNMPVDDANYGWDGLYKNQPLKPDVYVYIVNAECSTGEPMEVKGDISLIR